MFSHLFYTAVQMTEALGEFEQIVLLAIVRLAGDAYGTTIRREIEARTGRLVAIGALYTALERLERKGYIGSSMSDPTPQRGGRSKRYVTLKAAGIAALKRSRQALDQMWADVNPDALSVRTRG